MAGGGGNRPVVAMHWFRKGLRIHDNPALLASISAASASPNGGKIFPVFVMDGDCYQIRKCTALRANFLVECLTDLDANLRACGSRLYVVSGDPVEVFPTLFNNFGVTHLTFEGDETGEPYALKRDETVLNLANKAGIETKICCSETLHPLAGGYVTKIGGNAERVPITMGAFQGLLSRMGEVPKPVAAPTSRDFPDQDHSAYEGEMLPPKKPTDLPWPRCPRENVTPIWGPSDCRNLKPIARGGESKGLARLKEGMKQTAWVASFEKPKTACTSLKPSTLAISPYLSLGCLSPRTVWYAISESISRAPASVSKSKPPVSLHGQLMWRDFNNLIAHSANNRNAGSWGVMEGNPYCRQVPWSKDDELLNAWKEGRTGYPWIDACMAQLKAEGWIHHLGRHAVACFLTRGDLWQSWEEGAAHFEAELLDADYALNGFNWLWLSCSGFFYQYFRCYSPVAFQKKNDPSGQYIRKWLPVLARIPDKYIYEPWKAPKSVQKDAGVQIGKDYPKPIVEHGAVSKENMSKMAYAYDEHKARMEETKGKGVGKGGKEPPKKKRKKQMKLK
eukprot:CAMPEP_0197453670 /NCGR_PEP_ID=MMETSP1175-20131217/35645_1 /TAXON_ID=1003142 /ORGANISM="Triceratium dubium, Strain CCMP147" /LENGTH=561 /DNA_ID=CAMNT_0042987035 /DNA_START=215 /DNA_END=1900 /DNA_ORIENTATION=-